MKNKASNFPKANSRPLKYHENIVVFCAGQPPYFPVMVQGKPNNNKVGTRKAHDATARTTKTVEGRKDGMKFPRSILEFAKVHGGYHPTEKPVPLLEYLIRTYTREGELVLDCTAGVASTCVAAKNTARNYLGIEMDAAYHAIGTERLKTLSDAR